MTRSLEEAPVFRTRSVAAIPSFATAVGVTLALAALAAWLVMAASPVRAAEQAVTIENFAFGPADLTIEVGDTVTWTNLDGAPHTATSTSGPASFDSGTLNTDGTFSFTFDTAGTYEYFCEIHPEMLGSITVTASAATAAPSASAPASSAPASSAAASMVPNTATDVSAGAPSSAQLSTLFALIALAGLGALATLRLRRG